MNFVVVAWHFLPEDNAEGYCTSRFVNSLAEAGHHVTVVTPVVDGPVSVFVSKQILRQSIDVVRVKLPSKTPTFRKVCRWLCMGKVFAWSFKEYYVALKDVLKRTDNPILVSRGLPINGSLVAYACRKMSKLWIAHFSDPEPFGYLGENDSGVRHRVSLKDRFFHCCLWLYVRKILNAADAISVTCEEVLPFFKMRFPCFYARFSQKFFVVPHIGDPVLVPEEVKDYREVSNVSVVSHVGYLSPERYVREVLGEVAEVNARVQGIELLFLGLVDHNAIGVLKDTAIAIRYIKSADPGEATNVACSSTVCLVVDSRTSFGFSPFLPSKFVYLLFQEKPIVAYALEGSSMSNFAKRFPEAGIYVASPAEKGTLARALEKAITHKEDHFNRDGIRRVFASNVVARRFVEKVRSVRGE